MHKLQFCLLHLIIVDLLRAGSFSNCDCTIEGKLQPINISGKMFIDLVIENESHFNSTNQANFREFKEFHDICKLKNARDSLPKIYNRLINIILQPVYRLINDNFRFSLVVSALNDQNVQKEAIDMIYKYGRTDFIKAYSKEIYIRLKDVNEPDAARLLILCDLNKDEISNILKSKVYLYPEVNARIGDTVIENRLIDEFKKSCEKNTIVNLSKSLSYIGSKKSVLALIEGLADSSYYSGHNQTISIRYYILSVLGNICPCEKLFNEDFDRYAHSVGVKVTMENQYSFGDSVKLYYGKLYEWIDKNYHIKIEGLKNTSRLYSWGSNKKGYLCYKKANKSDSLNIGKIKKIQNENINKKP
jgi:hypothetical protein